MNAMGLGRAGLLLLLGWLTAFVPACLVEPLHAEAQQTPATRVIGFVGNGASDTRGSRAEVEAFRDGLRDLGWIEGKTVRIEYRWADGNVDRFPELVAELVRLKVDVLFVAGPPAIRAARQATSTIPIVIGAILTDPVAYGFVTSFARPGANVTGMASQYEDIITKQVQLLREAMPKLTRLFVLRHTGSAPVTADVAVAAAQQIGLKAEMLKVSDASEYEGAFRTARNAGAQAMHVMPSPIFNVHRRQLIELAARYRLPAMYEFGEYVRDGGLISYGPSLPAMFRSATRHIDRILKGAKAGDLPMERATTFELVVNLRTAKTLGLTIPSSLLQRADEIIQ